jgi:hypothetical protein
VLVLIRRVRYPKLTARIIAWYHSRKSRSDRPVRMGHH